jgi:hypothetical protein
VTAKPKKIHCIHLLSSVKQIPYLTIVFFKCIFNDAGYTVAIMCSIKEKQTMKGTPVEVANEEDDIDSLRRRSMLVLGPTGARSSTRPKSAAKR